MELVYLPDPMTRMGTWITFSTWDEITFNNTAGKQQLKHCKEVKTNEKNCSICLQKKKRILSEYIKSKQTNCRNTASIQEEDEDEDKEKTNTVEDNNDKS